MYRSVVHSRFALHVYYSYKTILSGEASIIQPRTQVVGVSPTSFSTTMSPWIDSLRACATLCTFSYQLSSLQITSAKNAATSSGIDAFGIAGKLDDKKMLDQVMPLVVDLSRNGLGSERHIRHRHQ